MKLAAWWIAGAVVALVLVGLASVNIAAGTAILWGVALAAFAVAAATGGRRSRQFVLPLVLVGVVGVTQILVVTYLHAAGRYLSIERHAPTWLIALGGVAVCAGVSLASALAWSWLRDVEGNAQKLRVPFVLFAAATALLPVALVVTLPEMRQSGEADYFSRPVMGAGLGVLGLVLISVGQMWWVRGSPRLWALAVAAVALPIVFYAIAPSFFLKGGGQYAYRYASYDVRIRPDPTKPGTFMLTETAQAIVNGVKKPSVARTRYVVGVPAGFLCKHVTFRPPFGDYTEVKIATVNMQGLAPNQIIIPHFLSHLEDHNSVDIQSYPTEETAEWKLSTLDDGVNFFYGPAVPGPLSGVVKLFMGLASVREWTLLVGSLILVAGGLILRDVIKDKLKEWLESHFPGPKHPVAPPSTVDRPSSS